MPVRFAGRQNAHQSSKNGSTATPSISLGATATYVLLTFATLIAFGDDVNAVSHFVLPVLGVLAIGWPLYQLVKPGQPGPFSRYPWIALGLAVVALAYAAVLYRRDPRLGERVGSIVADQD